MSRLASWPFRFHSLNPISTHFTSPSERHVTAERLLEMIFLLNLTSFRMFINACFSRRALFFPTKEIQFLFLYFKLFFKKYPIHGGWVDFCQFEGFK